MTRIQFSVQEWEIPQTLNQISTGINQVTEQLSQLTEKLGVVIEAQAKLKSMCTDMSHDATKDRS